MLREFHWLLDSRFDITELLMNTFLVLIGIFIFIPHSPAFFPIFQTSQVLSEQIIGVTFLISASINLFRLLYVKKLPSLVILFFQTMTLACFTFLAFNSFFIDRDLFFHFFFFVSFCIISFLILVQT